MENKKNSFPHLQSVDSVLTKLVYYAIPSCSVSVMYTETHKLNCEAAVYKLGYCLFKRARPTDHRTKVSLSVR